MHLGPLESAQVGPCVTLALEQHGVTPLEVRLPHNPKVEEGKSRLHSSGAAFRFHKQTTFNDINIHTEYISKIRFLHSHMPINMFSEKC